MTTHSLGAYLGKWTSLIRLPYTSLMATSTDRSMGALVRKYREAAGLKQESLAELLSREMGTPIEQNRISNLERGERWARQDEAIYDALRRVLNIPVQEMVNARMGIDYPGEQPTTLAEIIERDPSLSDAAKQHLLTQYGLLQMASQQERAGKQASASKPTPRKKSTG